VAIEGLTDEYVVRRILQFSGLTCGYVRGLAGKPALVANLQKYNQAARFANWFVLLDLDQDADCAPTYIQSLLAKRAEGLLLRIPVVGPGYSSRILEFVEQSRNQWRPEVAIENSDSLRRCIAALQNWKLIGAD